MEKCCRDCKFCQKYRHAKPRPVVALPKADRFNQVVAMDLKEVQKGKLWILHMVDNATRYTAAGIINTKRKEVVLKKIFQIWLTYFGSMGKLHSDCGGEFENDVLKEMAEMFGIEISTTPGESPFSNGVVERGNAMLYETMMKTQEDTKCDMETALAWAVCAKNCLQNVSGYSPNQLVFGQNIILPSVAHDELPALKQTTKSDLVRDNLNALHKARENFMKSESSERIRRALRHNVRTYSEVVFNPGEKVYFKCRNDKGWRGPAKVLGKECNFILIRQGASYFRCHPCHLIKVSPSDDEIQRNDIEHANTSLKETRTAGEKTQEQSGMKSEKSSDSEDSDEEESSMTQTVEVVPEDNIQENQPDDDLPENENSEEEPVEVLTEGTHKRQHSKEPLALRALRNYNNPGLKEISRAENINQSHPHTEVSQEESDNEVELLKQASSKPRPKTTVQYSLEDGTTAKAHVLSAQPKQTQKAKWKDWVNVQVVGQEEPIAVDWRKVIWWREVCNTEQVLTLTSIEECQSDIIEAKEREISNLVENDVFECVEDQGQKAVSCRWIFTEKKKPDGNIILKARLVARGFEERLVDKKVDSPTCSRQSLRLAFITATSMNWELHALDISSAFLQGNLLKRTVYVRPPPGVCEPGKIWLLKRCLYGLSDAPREWYERVCEEMKKMGAVISIYDKSMFMWHEESNLVGLIITHVDDFQYCGTLKWQEKVIDNIAKIFKISKKEKGSFKYIGLNIEQNGQEIYIDQGGYCKNLKEIDISLERKKQMDELLTSEEKAQLRSVSGQVLWATSQTRPDSAFDGCQISNNGSEATVKCLSEANKTIRKLKTDQFKILYPSLGDPTMLRVVIYGDGSHASLPSGASQGGNIVFLVGKNGKAAPVSWKSKRLDRVTKSPLATEISAVADAADHGHLVASMTEELFCLKKLPQIELLTDSFSLKEHLESKKVISDPRLRVDIARLREMSDLGEVLVKWVPSGLQLADSLTKKGASTDLLRKVLATGVLPEHQTGQM